MAHSSRNAKILERCIAMSEGGKPADKYKEFYSDKPDYNQKNYVNKFDVNNSYKSSSTSFSKGNLNVTSSSGSSSSGGKIGPNLVGFSMF
jgi:hypothetical protein